MSGDAEERDEAAVRVPPGWNRLELAARRLLDAHGAVRRRVRAAEDRVAELEAALRDVSSGDLNPIELAETVETLQTENEDLRRRLDQARERITRIMDRLDFLQQEP